MRSLFFMIIDFQGERERSVYSLFKSVYVSPPPPNGTVSRGQATGRTLRPHSWQCCLPRLFSCKLVSHQGFKDLLLKGVKTFPKEERGKERYEDRSIRNKHLEEELQTFNFLSLRMADAFHIPTSSY